MRTDRQDSGIVIEFLWRSDQMDELDQQLIARLRANARAPVAELAQALRVSRGTVTNRMAKLEREGVITGYTVRLRAESLPDEIRAWTSIAVEGNQQKLVLALLAERGVDALHDTNGRWDLLAELRVANLAELSALLERIRAMPGVSATETSLHLQSFRG
jgi:DNA-binding Lrp family transcriptional regulator